MTNAASMSETFHTMNDAGVIDSLRLKISTVSCKKRIVSVLSIHYLLDAGVARLAYPNSPVKLDNFS
jgi:hypothetical protein